jgi:FkbM family methyltransferase
MAGVIRTLVRATIPVHKREQWRESAAELLYRASRVLAPNALYNSLPNAIVRRPESSLAIDLDLVLGHYKQTHERIRYLQIGASDGVYDDPLFPLIEKYSLSGVLVEPQLEMIKQAQHNYARFGDRFTFVNAALDATDGERPLYRIPPEVPGPEWIYRLASFDKDVILKHALGFPGMQAAIAAQPVPCMTFETLLRGYNVNPIDVLQIDAEGYDGRLLELFDVPARKVPIVRYEHVHLRPEEQERTWNMLIDNGYKVAICGFDTLAYHFQGQG